MKKNSLIMIFAFFILGGCSKQKPIELLVTHWQNTNMRAQMNPLRSIASTTNSSQCLGDLMNAEHLKSEVLSFESKIKGSPVKGRWNHIDLSTLPIPQANFLIKYGSSIGDLANPGSIDYSTCNDLICIFNKIYNKDNDYIAGYVHYLWYLKFGSYLSLDNKVPYQKSLIAGEYQNAIHPVSSYLYDAHELYGIWGLIHLVNDKYTNLTNLKEIQRIPRGTQLEGFEGRACGLAYANTEILLSDACLVTFVNDRNQGPLYSSILHELSHVLDFSEAQNTNMSQRYRSETQDYLNLSGFSKEEYVDTNGALVSKWNLSANAKYYRSYSATSPLENFADSLAFYRLEGDDILKKIENTQYNWIGQNYFDGKNFENHSQLNSFLDKYKTKYVSTLFFKVLSCSTSTEVSSSNYLAAKDFTGLTLTESMLTCLSTEANNIADELTQEVQLSEFDGCKITKSKSNNQMIWEGEIKRLLRDDINSYLQKIATIPGFLEQMEKFKNLLDSNEMANQAFFECYQGRMSSIPVGCYDKKLQEIIEIRATNVGIPQDQLGEVVNLYVRKYPYLDTINALNISYKSILDSNSEELRISSERLWETCSAEAADDSSPPRPGQFTPSSGYIVSSLFNCLNDKMPETISDFIESISFEELGISNEKEKLIVREFTTPRLVDFLNSIHDRKSKQESEELLLIFNENKISITNKLLSDFSWIQSLNNKSRYIKSCKEQSFKQINSSPLYHTKKEFFTKLIEDDICSVILLNNDFIDFIKKSNHDLIDDIDSKIEEQLIPNARAEANECLRKIPWKWDKTKAIVRIPRKICFSSSWKDIKDKLSEEIMKLPNVKRFKLSKAYVGSQIETRKDDTTKLIESEYF